MQLTKEFYSVELAGKFISTHNIIEVNINGWAGFCYVTYIN